MSNAIDLPDAKLAEASSAPLSEFSFLCVAMVAADNCRGPHPFRGPQPSAAPKAMDTLLSFLNLKWLPGRVADLQPRLVRLLQAQKSIADALSPDAAGRYRALSDEAIAAVQSIDPTRLGTLLLACMRLQSVMLGKPLPEIPVPRLQFEAPASCTEDGYSQTSGIQPDQPSSQRPATPTG